MKVFEIRKTLRFEKSYAPHDFLYIAVDLTLYLYCLFIC